MGLFNRIFRSSQKPTIEVETNDVRQAAAEIRAANKQMLKAAQSIKTTTDSLGSSWNSSVYKNFRTRIKKTEAVYERYDEIINGLTQFLDEASNAYDKADKNIHDVADGF